MKKADNREFALQWLIKAEHDLITARQTLSMNSYAVEARYPGDFYEPPIEDAMEALKTAEDFTEKIKALLI